MSSEDTILNKVAFEKAIEVLSFVELVFLYHLLAGISTTDIAKTMKVSRRYTVRLHSQIKNKMKGFKL
jgi:DNA-directed RNA polymerase specialized sigma subunit